jgi:mRNA-degrading endonuclease RelE of RelBE toxin-antitoxin system
LKGLKGGWASWLKTLYAMKNLSRIDKLCETRVGHYRIAYKLEPCKIIVVHIGQRRSFYDELKYI